MEVGELKRQLIIRVSIYAVVFIGIVLIGVYLSKTKQSFMEKHDWLRSDIRSMTGKIEGLSQKAVEFTDAVIAWEELDERQQELRGLRINDAKALLDDLKVKYKLSDFELVFSKPEEVKEVYVSDTVVVISSDVSMTFKGVTDEYIFGFVSEVLDEYPGYIEVRSFLVKRNNEVTKAVLEELSNGVSPKLVEGKIKFVWRDLKYQGPVDGGENSDAVNSSEVGG